LIDDNPIEEDESEGSDDDEGKNRKRKKSDDEDELDDGLDEDDYDLLEQNLGVKMDRKVHKLYIFSVFKQKWFLLSPNCLLSHINGYK